MLRLLPPLREHDPAHDSPAAAAAAAVARRSASDERARRLTPRLAEGRLPACAASPRAGDQGADRWEPSAPCRPWKTAVQHLPECLSVVAHITSEVFFRTLFDLISSSRSRYNFHPAWLQW